MKLSSLKLLAATTLLTPAVAFAIPNASWPVDFGLVSTYDVSSVPGALADGNSPDGDYKFENPAGAFGGIDLILLLNTVVSTDGLTALVYWSPVGGASFDEVFLKAGNAFLTWDVSAVNWSLYDSFTVTNSQIFNTNGNPPTPPLHGISHISLTGRPGTPPPPPPPPPPAGVPDGGATAMLLGAGLVALAWMKRRSGN